MKRESIERPNSPGCFRMPRLLGIICLLSSTSEKILTAPKMDSSPSFHTTNINSKHSNASISSGMNLLFPALFIGALSLVLFFSYRISHRHDKQKLFFESLSHVKLPQSSLNDIKAEYQKLERLLTRVNALITTQVKKEATAVLLRVKKVTPLSRAEKRLVCLELRPRLSEDAMELALSLPPSVLENLLIASQSQEVQFAIAVLRIEALLKLGSEQLWHQRVEAEQAASAVHQSAIALLRQLQTTPAGSRIVQILALSADPKVDFKEAIQTEYASMCADDQRKFLLFYAMLLPDPILASQALEGIIGADPSLFSQVPTLSKEESAGLSAARFYHNHPILFKTLLCNKHIARSCEKGECSYLLEPAINSCNLAALSVLLKYTIEALEYEKQLSDQAALDLAFQKTE